MYKSVSLSCLLSVQSNAYYVAERPVSLKHAELKEKLAGRFIVLDGPDGCGKTTQAKVLAERLKETGLQTDLFRDPGATAIGEKIRRVLLDPEHDAMDVRCELLLYMAARAQLWAEKIVPALAAAKCVILDRWLSSTCAYQGYAGGSGIKHIIELAARALERPWPDLTIILDVDLDTAAKRLKQTPDRIEQKGRNFQDKVRTGFLELAALRDDVVVIEADDDIQQVHQKIVRLLQTRKW